MPEIHCIIGSENLGKTTVQVKLFESILRIYDNYNIDLCKYSINTLGDFLATIEIYLNEETHKELLIKKTNANSESSIGREKTQDNKNSSFKILLHTAGDQISNFKILKKKIEDNKLNINEFDIIIFCLSIEKPTPNIPYTDTPYNMNINSIPIKISLKKKEDQDFFSSLWSHVTQDTFHNCYNGIDFQFNSLVIKLLARIDEKIKKIY